jgi:hypothetical protein
MPMARLRQSYLAPQLTNIYLTDMRISPFKAVAGGLALVLCIFVTQPASARSQKHRLPPSSVPNIMVDESGTPVIMQGLERPKRAIRERGNTNKEAERPEKEPERRANIPRGSSSFVAPAALPRTPLMGQARAVAPYSPPPVPNPSQSIMQSNESFPLYRGLGNNPTDRDSYVRYQFNNR